MPPLALSDEELDLVMRPAAPLPRARCNGFLQAIAEALKDCREPGPGAAFRICREQQRKFFDAPDVSRGNDTSKWRS
jgi:hypothetical protein